MNEAIPTQSDPQSRSGAGTSATAKAQELTRTAAERSQEMRRAAVREQALREKMRRLESVGRELDQHTAGDTLANLSDANWDEIKEQLDGLHREAEKYIRDNPTKSVLSAAGVGFVLGLLMKR
ncbi:MAG: ElaB/YqjD/DUF883 family membrane-anchored ribosome-binding protein [Verrucomicrobiales bacterium]|jgi:ElaB/YqjD/DUF883 family membrane-anchored ribosome-binding protein